MERKIRSKFLAVTCGEEEGVFWVSHERNHIAIEVELDVIDFIDQFITPQILNIKDLDEQKLYRLLTEIHFLQDKVQVESESRDILNNWLNKFDKEIRWFRYCNVMVNYAAREQEPVKNILNEILKIGQELHRELLAFQQPIYILFLTPKEYRDLQIEFNIPSDISTFVDSRTLLIMDYESYFKKNNTRSFYPTVRHELIHILFGQYAYYLPFWLEEGLCDYYSKKYRIDYLNYELKKEELISFVEIHSEKVNYIAQLSSFNSIQHVFYPQVVSFTDFLFRTLTEECVWNIIRKSSILRDFFDVLEKNYGITLIDLQFEWETFIKK